MLLIDIDAQGNVGTSLGIRGERTLYHVLVDEPVTPDDVIVPVRGHLDVITSDATLARPRSGWRACDGGRAIACSPIAWRLLRRQVPVHHPRLRPVAVAAQPERAHRSPTRC